MFETQEIDQENVILNGKKTAAASKATNKPTGSHLSASKNGKPRILVLPYYEDNVISKKQFQFPQSRYGAARVTAEWSSRTDFDHKHLRIAALRATLQEGRVQTPF